MSEDFSIPDGIDEEVLNFLKQPTPFTESKKKTSKEDLREYYKDSITIPREVLTRLLDKELYTLEMLEKYIITLTSVRNELDPVSEEEIKLVIDALAWVQQSIDLNTLTVVAVQSLEGFDDYPNHN